MKSRFSVRRHDGDPAEVSVQVVPAELSSHVGGRASANDKVMAAQRERAVNPLWMITVAMAFMFALLAVLVSFD
ncbi:MAG TPA: hypothetical protein VK025_13670 [Steroidobacter sp.]|jgi:hypothetical protein|nr:hypothetical protein [Steroidobacteraceae bacterium]HLS82445.1 hypothetical protein [Steroidobacter sp.]